MSKRILITGGAGFIGSEFTRQAVARGYRVSVLDSLTYAGDRSRLKSVSSKIVFHRTDISNTRAVTFLIKRLRPEIIVHFAAETHVDRSILDGQIFLVTNILGTQVLLEASRAFGVKKFVHMSTDEVYGDVKRGDASERSPFQPNSPYSVSKAAADMLVSAYARTYKLQVNIVRASNNYGPWQYPEKLIPVIISKALRHEKVPVYAKGLNVREWLFVSDCASGVMAVMERGLEGEAYNISSGIHRRNIDVVRAVLRLLKRPESLIQFVEDRPGHDFRYSISCAKANEELGWKPSYNFERGLAETVSWYQAHQRWLDTKVESLRSYWDRVYKVA